MPNWCENQLTVSGPDDQLEELIRLSLGPEGELMDFSRLLPVPPILSEGGSWRDLPDFHGLSSVFAALPRDEQHAFLLENPGFALAFMLGKHSDAGWYEWCVQYWGTKWTASEFREQTREPGLWRFEMDTAWSPPSRMMLSLSARFPELRFQLVSFELGNGHAACETFLAGERVSVLTPQDPQEMLMLAEEHWPRAAEWLRDWLFEDVPDEVDVSL